MADDRITIDPEFLPPSREGGGRRTAWLAASAAVVAAIAFGWLLGSPGTTEPSDLAATDSTTTTVPSTTSTTVAQTTTIPVAEPLGETVLPLSELVLGFTRVVAPVDGYLTNLNLRLGDQAVANRHRRRVCKISQLTYVTRPTIILYNFH